MAAKKLGVSIVTPEVLRPRQTFSAPVKIDGIARGEDVMLTIAAVDEGILRLTKFASPNPVDYYYGKKRLGVEVRDDYGRILDANLGAAARFGGDQLGGEGLTVVPVKSVALFEGPVQVDDNGVATIPLEVPDFNGELRLMAVAWSVDKLGSLAQPLTVRDAAPAVLSLPRFLGPDDDAQATLLIDNVDGAPGDYAVTVTGGAPVSAETTRTFTLDKAQQATALFPVTAGAVGVGEVSLTVSGPNKFSVSRSYPIEVRTPYFPVTQVTTSPLQPGGAVTLNNQLIADYIDGSTSVSVSFSRLRGVDPGPLLDSLYRYPYGCSEQLVSAAMPLLYLNELGAEAGREPEYDARARVQDAVNQLLNRQGADGAFGLWREGDASGSPWLGAYVTDFLYRAKDNGYGVPQDALDRAYDAMAKVAKTNGWVYVGYNMQAFEGRWSNDTTDQLRKRSAAYALYVLARAGRADLSDLRYYHDALIDNVKSPLAKAYVGAALAMMGDRARSLSAFQKAIVSLGYENTGDYYQTPLRDAAGVLALLAEARDSALVNDASDRFVELMKEPPRMHTQEKAYVLLASQALLRASGPIELTRNGSAIDLRSPAPRFNLATDDLAGEVTFANAGEGPLYSSVSVYGAPRVAPAAIDAGYSLTKRVYTRAGAPADLAAVKQNDRLVIVIDGAAAADRVHPSVIADLLPAGLEIEAVLRPEDGARHSSSGTSGPYEWIGKIAYPKVAEARDDRFVAAIDLYDRGTFKLAYIVRAVTPGDFVFPGAVIEDMYKPGVFARTATARLKIASANSE
ncbi:MAG: alpha-2-macroglobulin family protein [Parvularculaceae bacterium]